MNIRPAGSTIREGDLLVEKNLPLRPTDLAALAMGGVTMVRVRRRPRVAFLPTGSELIPPSVEPTRGKNVDTNSLLLKTALIEAGAEPLIFPITPDRPEQLLERLNEALSCADVVILNAGTAKGGEDFNFGILGQRGRLIHHYIAAAPGRPMALGVADGKPVINLPGPTMAAFFGMEWCVTAVIRRILRLPMAERQRVRGILMENIRSTPHMAILVRMNAVRRGDGVYELHPLSFHTGNAAAPMASNAMYVSGLGESFRAKGEMLEAELLRGEEFCGDH